MAANIDLTSQKWLDIIFEGRNKSYGAYTLRQQSSKRHLIAFVFSLAFVIVVIFATIMVKNITEKNLRHIEDDSLVFRNIQLESPPPPEEIIEHRVEAPPPIEMAKTIQFTVPKIEKDELVKEGDEIKTQDDVLEQPTAIVSNFDNLEGRDDGLGILPDALLEDKVIVQAVEDNKTYEHGLIEQNPSFPGGESAMYEWLSKNINYPVIAQENNIQGRVTLQFVVGKNGEIENIIVIRGVDSSLDREAVRVVKAMPTWIPGRQGGNAVKVRYTLPVQFRLH
ncbi:MAG: energy transducer TonB [Porphyromonadaceae bacterium]|jgi:protein TonB|nr:energy transducer TonB [Porphyromonadaceae bacterium]